MSDTRMNNDLGADAAAVAAAEPVASDQLSHDDLESFRDQLSRLNLIASGERDCDLSDNDEAALRALLRSHRDLLDAMKAVYQAMDQQMLVKPNGWYTAAWICASAAIKKAEGR